MDIFWLQTGFAALLGLCFGSFVNVAVYRLPKMMQQQWRNWCAEEFSLDSNNETAITLSKPASSCPHCQHRIRWYENIPLASYLLLLGRCSQCREPISPRYPMVEIGAALLTVIAYAKLGWTFDTIVISGLLLTLLTLALIDWDTQLLPDNLTLPLLWVGLLYNANPLELFQAGISLSAALYGATLGYLTLWSVNAAFSLLRNEQGMGNGDFKLLAALGAWLGYQALPEVILLSCGLACVYALFAAAAGQNARKFAFGPFLAAAGFISFCFGHSIRLSYLTWAGLV